MLYLRHRKHQMEDQLILQTVHLAVETGGGMFTLADKPLFHEDSRHTVWIASTGTVFSYYDEDRKSLVAQPLGVSGVSGELIPRLKKGFSDHQGNLWLIYPHNLSLVSFSYSNIMQIDLGTKRDTRSVMQDHEGNILLGTVDGEIAKYSPDGKLIGYLSTLCSNASKDEIIKEYGKEYSKPRAYHTNSKGAQEAHEHHADCCTLVKLDGSLVEVAFCYSLKEVHDVALQSEHYALGLRVAHTAVVLDDHRFALYIDRTEFF